MQSPLTHNNRNCWTILDILEWTTLYFKRHGIENGRVDAEVLLANILESKRIDLYLHYDQPLTADELHRFKGLIKRRADREPIAYIIGEKEFWSLCFKVSKDILFPADKDSILLPEKPSLTHPYLSFTITFQRLSNILTEGF